MSFAYDCARLRAAFADGRLSGLESTDDESACPIDRSEAEFRGAWLDGFMIGRIEAQIWTRFAA